MFQQISETELFNKSFIFQFIFPIFFLIEDARVLDQVREVLRGLQVLRVLPEFHEDPLADLRVHLQHHGGDLHRGALLGGLDREHELRDALAHGRQAELGLIPAGLEEGNPVEAKDLFSIYLLAVKKRAQPRRRSQKRPC